MTTKAYDVTEDVPFVNGAPVPASRVVHLMEAEAAFDLGLGRIKPKPGASAVGRKQRADPIIPVG